MSKEDCETFQRRHEQPVDIRKSLFRWGMYKQEATQESSEVKWFPVGSVWPPLIGGLSPSPDLWPQLLYL